MAGQCQAKTRGTDHPDVPQSDDDRRAAVRLRPFRSRWRRVQRAARRGALSLVQ